MYIKLYLPERKDKTKCAPSCRFLRISVTFDWCDLYNENVRKGIDFKNQIRCKKCLKAEVKDEK